MVPRTVALRVDPRVETRPRLLAAVGRWGSALLVLILLGGCSKPPPKRAKRAHSPAPAAAPVPTPEEQAPAAAAPSPAPSPMAVRVAEPAPAPPARRALTVDHDPSPPPAPPPPRRAARIAAARSPAAAPRPAPEPAAKPVVDKSSGSSCEGGSGKGELLSVQGVAADDVLNVREAPDRTSAILGALPPGATGVRGTANRKRVGSSSWREIECGKIRGWVNERFLAQ